MLLRFFERLILVITALTLLCTAILAVLLPVLDLYDLEIPYLSQDFVSSLQVVDYPENEQGLKSFRSTIAFILLIAILLSICLYLGTVIFRKSIRVKAVSRKFQDFSLIYTEYFRENLLRLEILDQPDNVVSAEEKQLVFDKITVSNGQFFKEVCNMLAAISAVYFGRRCSVNIKSYSYHSGAVETYSRDGSSHDSRKYTDDKYKEELRSSRYNSIFTQILSGERNHFVSNDLRKLGKSGKYVNDANPTWSDHYRSCMVVPIRSYNHSDNERNVLGFICIDSLSRHFREDYFLDITKIVSDLLYVYFDIIVIRSRVQDERLKLGESEKNEKESNDGKDRKKK